MHRTVAALACTFAALPAQLPPGHAAVASHDQFTGACTIDVLSPAGALTPLQGLDPVTVGTGLNDGVRSLLATRDGLLVAGLVVDNGIGTQPLPLSLRLIVPSGSAVVDLPLATVMQVPPGTLWAIVDLDERDDGSILVAAAEQSFLGSPANNAVFVVDRNGAVQTIATASLTQGSLTSIADCGDRFVAGLDQSLRLGSVTLESLAFDGLTPSFTITAVAGLFGFGSAMPIARDVDGDLVFCMPFHPNGSSLHRAAHAANAAVRPVPFAPLSLFAAEVNRSSGEVTCLAFQVAGGFLLSHTDSLVGGTTAGPGVAPSGAFALAVRENPLAFGLGNPPANRPWLGSFGLAPALGNRAFGLRLGAPAAAAATAFVFGGAVRANVATPFGTLLVDPAAGIVGLAVAAIPAGGAGVVPLPLPAATHLRGLRFVLQALVVGSSANALSNGLELTLQ